MPEFADLPEILLRSDLASLVGRDPRGVELMAARGLAAAPTHRHQGRAVWQEPAATDWFRSLHEHAVIVSAGALALSEIKAYGVYLCPLTSGHVGLARPETLVTYEKGGSGQVFEVTAVETVNQAVPGTRDTALRTWNIVRDDAPLGTSGQPWTVFHLTRIGGIGTITPSIQQGRYLRLEDVQEALTTDRLTVRTLDEAFPARK
ncbi:hypothetical protein ACFO3J_02165 [Streptomyces polygonati]|uniref:Uncharacterized protein n=1 Tax=Streptomyces polygonati TaxID=1617087 RepID=A0ABV8HJ24_9ACTN